MARLLVVLGALCGLGLAAGCFVVSDASEYEVGGAGFVDLDFTMRAMGPHRGQLINIELASPDNVMRGHAKVILSPEALDPYPPERVRMRQVVREPGSRLHFYADVNGNGAFDPMGGTASFDHTWVEEVPDDGVVDFTHRFNFQNVATVAPIGEDLVLRTDQALRAADVTVATIVGPTEKVVELRVTFLADGTEVGLYRIHPGTNRVPPELTLEGIIDAGSPYRVELLVGKESLVDERVTAPLSGALVIEIPREAVVDRLPGGGVRG